MEGIYPPGAPSCEVCPDFPDLASSSYPSLRWIDHSPETAVQLFFREAFHPQGKRLGNLSQPYSLQWFLDLENQRHGKNARWLPKLLEFSKHAGETFLGLGQCLGTDWLQFARHGASVVVCNSSSTLLHWTRRNFELRGFKAKFFHTSSANLPLESASIDVACINYLFSENEDLPKVVQEVYRVLKPGGKILAVTPARYDLDFWIDTMFFWNRFLPSNPKGQGAVKAHSAKELRQTFHKFIDHRVHKRQLRRSELPHVWRWLPLPLLARIMGRILVIKAFKPLSAAMPVQPSLAA